MRTKDFLQLEIVKSVYRADITEAEVKKTIKLLAYLYKKYPIMKRHQLHPAGMGDDYMLDGGDLPGLMPSDEWGRNKGEFEHIRRKLNEVGNYIDDE